jgi:5-methylcytosine-specific restriction endonuclease McrA
MEKKCLLCGNNIIKKRLESKKVFNNRKYCSTKCAAVANKGCNLKNLSESIIIKRTESINKSIKERMASGWVPTIIGWHKGKPHSEEHKRKMSESMKGLKHKKFSQETRDKMSKRMMGNKFCLGVRCSDESRKKHSDAQKKIVLSGKHHLWQGGITNKKYPEDWTATLRRSIRERDNYTCQICSKQQTDRAHAIHHIDYNKENCNPENLITLCVPCHAKTNQKREYWIEYFKKT